MKPDRTPKRRSIAGFTLIEALVAMVLMATILVALATITAQWMPNWNRGMARVQRDDDLALGLDRFVADLAAAEFIPANRQTLKPYFDGTSDSVTFVRTALSPNAAPGLEIVHFAEVKTANGLALVRTQAPFVRVEQTDRDERADRDDGPRFANPVALINEPYSVSLSYAGADRVWHDTWQQAPLLPKAVRLTVRDARTRRALTVSTATLLHVEVPATCIKTKSFADCLSSLQRRAGPADAAAQSPVPPSGQSL